MDTLVNYCLCIGLQCPGLYGHINELLSSYCITLSRFIWTHQLIIVYVLRYNVQVYTDIFVNYCLCIALQCPYIFLSKNMDQFCYW